MGTGLSRTIVWVVSTLTILAASYETYAVATGHITISRFCRDLAEGYHPVYVFAGVLLAMLYGAALLGTQLPTLIRAMVLAWLFVFGHIFWGFC